MAVFVSIGAPEWFPATRMSKYLLTQFIVSVFALLDGKAESSQVDSDDASSSTPYDKVLNRVTISLTIVTW
jgi:hypothetical protein